MTPLQAQSFLTGQCSSLILSEDEQIVCPKCDTQTDTLYCTIAMIVDIMAIIVYSMLLKTLIVELSLNSVS